MAPRGRPGKITIKGPILSRKTVFCYWCKRGAGQKIINSNDTTTEVAPPNQV